VLVRSPDHPAAIRYRVLITVLPTSDEKSGMDPALIRYENVDHAVQMIEKREDVESEFAPPFFHGPV